VTTIVLAIESQTVLAELSEYAAGDRGVRVVQRGDPWTCALTLLEGLTGVQLHALRLDDLPAIHRRVGAREAASKLSHLLTHPIVSQETSHD
jgi:hypothetical protein